MKTYFYPAATETQLYQGTKYLDLLWWFFLCLVYLCQSDIFLCFCCRCDERFEQLEQPVDSQLRFAVRGGDERGAVPLFGARRPGRL